MTQEITNLGKQQVGCDASDLPDLLPCPFCGSPGRICQEDEDEYTHKKSELYWAECSNCKCKVGQDNTGLDGMMNTGVFDSAGNAAIAWNKRAS